MLEHDKVVVIQTGVLRNRHIVDCVERGQHRKALFALIVHRIINVYSGTLHTDTPYECNGYLLFCSYSCFISDAFIFRKMFIDTECAVCVCVL